VNQSLRIPCSQWLLGTNPPIWRRLLVPAVLTLAQLHEVVQTAMGWQGSHMHEFRSGQRYFGKPDPEYLSMGMPPVESERTVRLSDVLRRVTAALTFAGYAAFQWLEREGSFLQTVWHELTCSRKTLPIKVGVLS